MKRLKPINYRKTQQGVVLITALVFLVILTLLGITSMSTNTLEERMAANSQEMNRVFQAAESGLETAFLDANSFGGTTDGFSNTGTSTNLGSYDADISYTSTYRGRSEVEQGGDDGFVDIDDANPASKGFAYHYFDITSAGSMSSGSESRVAAGAKKFGN